MVGYKQSSQIPRSFHIAFFAAMILAANISLTQYLAYQFQYHPDLGAPLIGKVYLPVDWIVWTLDYYDLFPKAFDRAFGIVSFSAVVATFLYVILVSIGLRSSRGHEGIHGSARWAERRDIVQAGLLPPKRLFGQPKRSGVYVGGWTDKNGRLHYLRHDGPEHILAFAPTRSGKGVGLVIPTLLSWTESAIVYDIKGENWALTAGWRKRHAGNLVLKFDPASEDGSSVKFNPLEEIRIGTENEVADVQNLVTMIVDPDGKGMADHWAKTGHALLVGAVLHLLYKARNEGFQATLEGIAQILSDPDKPLEIVLRDMLHYPHLGSGDPHPVVAASARDMLNKSENERSGVFSTAMSYLTLYRDPLVARNTSRSEFRIEDLMNHEKPVTLYMIVRPRDKDRLRPLIRLILNQIARTLTGTLAFRDGHPVRSYKHRLLMMLDEFPSLGKLEVFQESLAFMAGYGIKAYLIVQDLAQLYAAYGRDESIMSNCHIRIAYAPNKIETAELLSKMAGTTTVVKRHVSTSGKRFGAMLGNVSESYQEIQRPLLTPDECQRLPSAIKDGQGHIVEAGDMLIFAAGHPPIYGKQILYFKDGVFMARARVLAPEESDRIQVKGSSNVQRTFRLA